jgi:hypothetical protein
MKEVVYIPQADTKATAQDAIFNKAKSQVQDALWFLVEQYRTGSATDIEIARSYLSTCEGLYNAAVENKAKAESGPSLFFRVLTKLGFSPRQQYR